METWPAVGLKAGRKVACPYGCGDSVAYNVVVVVGWGLRGRNLGGLESEWIFQPQL